MSSGGPTRGDADWSVVVLVASGDRTMEAHYELHTEHVRGDRWRVSTVRTHGTWTERGETSTFDSAAPTPADPWPLTLQHAVASVPAEVVVEDGRVVALADEDGWSRAARTAVYASPVPSDAFAAGEQLVDGDGLVGDLARTFVGRPPEGPWVRADTVGGVAAIRSESCVREPPATWTCTGTAAADPSTGARLFEVESRTSITADRRGLLAMESWYSGTLVALAAGGRSVDDRPVSGVRRVERR
jgi:hypothetical protein